MREERTGVSGPLGTSGGFLRRRNWHLTGRFGGRGVVGGEMEMSPNLGVTGGKRKDAEGDGLVTTSFERGVFVYLFEKELLIFW